MNSIITLVVLALIAACVAEDKLEQVDCTTKFVVPEDKVDPTHLSATCAKELKLPEPGKNDKPTTREEFTKTYDDKCLAKCTLEKLSLIKDGKMEKELILKHAAKMVAKGDEKFASMVAKYTEECFNKALEETDEKGCKAPSFFIFCVMDKQSQICLPDKEEGPK